MSIYNFTVQDANGLEVNMEDYKGKVLLIVNTATQCGLTPQYEGLQELYKEYNDLGFEILDFPSNQFLSQAPEPAPEITTFVQEEYGVTFKTFAKVNVNGETTYPIFDYLKSNAPGFLGSAIKWNFTKFLISREGEVIKRFAPKVEPIKLKKDIEELL